MNPRLSVPQTDALPAELLPPLPWSLAWWNSGLKDGVIGSRRFQLTNPGAGRHSWKRGRDALRQAQDKPALHYPLQGGNADAQGGGSLLDYSERKCVPAHEPP